MSTPYVGHPKYTYERDFRGYGEGGLKELKWPNGAKIAVSFVINYEEARPPSPVLVSVPLLTTTSPRVANAPSSPATAPPNHT